MSIPTPFNPLGTLGVVNIHDTLRLPVGTVVDGITYNNKFSGPVTGRVDIELSTFNANASFSGGMQFSVGEWGPAGSCALFFRQHDNGSRVFFMPIVYRSIGNTSYRFPPPSSGTLHTVVTVSQNGITGYTNSTVINDTTFSGIDGTGKEFKIASIGPLINAFDLHSVDFSDASKTLSFRPAIKNGVSGLYELHENIFFPINGAIAL